MRPFVIEVYWPDMTEELVAGLVVRTKAALAAHDWAIKYVGCEVAPRDETCFLRVAATQARAVKELVEVLGLAGARVAEMVDLSSPGRRSSSA